MSDIYHAICLHVRVFINNILYIKYIVSILSFFIEDVRKRHVSIVCSVVSIRFVSICHVSSCGMIYPTLIVRRGRQWYSQNTKACKRSDVNHHHTYDYDYPCRYY